MVLLSAIREQALDGVDEVTTRAQTFAGGGTTGAVIPRPRATT